MVNPFSFIKLLFFSEVTWLTLYCYTALVGVVNDDLTLISNTFFILGLAGLEYSIGLLLVITYKNTNKSIFFFDDKKSWDNNVYYQGTKLYVNRYFWNHD